jgi:hypothetical protein
LIAGGLRAVGVTEVEELLGEDVYVIELGRTGACQPLPEAVPVVCDAHTRTIDRDDGARESAFWRSGPDLGVVGVDAPG